MSDGANPTEPQGSGTKREDSKPNGPSVFQALTWIVTSAGLVGLLVAFGFIVESASASLLGVQVSPEDKVTYLSAAGGFIVDWFALMAQWIGGHPYLSGLIVVAIAVLTWFRQFLRPRTSRFVVLVSFFLLAAVSLVKLTVYDAPLLRVNGLFYRILYTQDPYGNTTFVQKRANKLQAAIVCARATNDQVAQIKPCALFSEPKRASSSAMLIYSLLTLIISWLAVSVVTSTHLKTPLLLRPIAVFFLLLAILGLPYTYGKLSKDIYLQSVRLIFTHTGEAEKRQEASIPQTGLILWDTKEQIVLFQLETAAIFYIDRSQVESIVSQAEMKDALEQELLHQLSNMPAKIAAPSAGGNTQ